MSGARRITALFTAISEDGAERRILHEDAFLKTARDGGVWFNKDREIAPFPAVSPADGGARRIFLTRAESVKLDLYRQWAVSAVSAVEVAP